MFNIFKRVKNKVNTTKKDYNLSYDNLAIPEIHKADSENEDDDVDMLLEEFYDFCDEVRIWVA